MLTSDTAQHSNAPRQKKTMHPSKTRHTSYKRKHNTHIYTWYLLKMLTPTHFRHLSSVRPRERDRSCQGLVYSDFPRFVRECLSLGLPEQGHDPATLRQKKNDREMKARWGCQAKTFAVGYPCILLLLLPVRSTYTRRAWWLVSACSYEWVPSTCMYF